MSDWKKNPAAEVGGQSHANHILRPLGSSLSALCAASGSMLIRNPRIEELVDLAPG